MAPTEEKDVPVPANPIADDNGGYDEEDHAREGDEFDSEEDDVDDEDGDEGDDEDLDDDDMDEGDDAGDGED